LESPPDQNAITSAFPTGLPSPARSSWTTCGEEGDACSAISTNPPDSGARHVASRWASPGPIRVAVRRSPGRANRGSMVQSPDSSTALRPRALAQGDPGRWTTTSRPEWTSSAGSTLARREKVPSRLMVIVRPPSRWTWPLQTAPRPAPVARSSRSPSKGGRAQVLGSRRSGGRTAAHASPILSSSSRMALHSSSSEANASRSSGSITILSGSRPGTRGGPLGARSTGHAARSGSVATTHLEWRRRGGSPSREDPSGTMPRSSLHRPSC